MDLFNAICWFPAFILLTYNVYALWRPLPRNRREVPELRKEALRISQESESKTSYLKELDRIIIDVQSKVEHLRLYVRFIDTYMAADLNALIARLRYYRVMLKSRLNSADLTESHLVVYSKFDAILKDMGLSTGQQTKDRKALTRTAFYTLAHMDQAEDILALVTDRGVYQLKHIKSLLRSLQKSPAAVLSDGML